MNKTKLRKFISIALIVSICVNVGVISIFDRRINDLTEEYSSKENDLRVALEDLEVETNRSNELSKSLDEANKELEKVNMTIKDLKNDEYKLVYMGDFKITYYCTEAWDHICGNGDGLTATGTQITPGRTVAVDPTVIPYGTQLYIEGIGWRTAEDCGGGVKGAHIDVAVETHDQAMSLGVNYEDVWILVKKTS